MRIERCALSAHGAKVSDEAVVCFTLCMLQVTQGDQVHAIKCIQFERQTTGLYKLIAQQLHLVVVGLIFRVIYYNTGGRVAGCQAFLLGIKEDRRLKETLCSETAFVVRIPTLLPSGSFHLAHGQSVADRCYRRCRVMTALGCKQAELMAQPQ